MRGRSPGLYAANFPDLSRSAVLLAADMLDPIAQKPNRGCTDRLERPKCDVVHALTENGEPTKTKGGISHKRVTTIATTQKQKLEQKSQVHPLHLWAGGAFVRSGGGPDG